MSARTKKILALVAAASAQPDEIMEPPEEVLLYNVPYDHEVDEIMEFGPTNDDIFYYVADASAALDEVIISQSVIQKKDTRDSNDPSALHQLEEMSDDDGPSSLHQLEEMSDDDYIPGTPQHVSESSTCESEEDISETTQDTLVLPDKCNKIRVCKDLRMHGKAYLGYERPKGSKKTHHGIQRGARCLKARCNSEKCKVMCSKIKEGQRKKIFEAFWAMSWSEKRVYVNSLVVAIIPKRRTTSAQDSRRSATLQYNLVSSGERLRVCKKMFLATLDVGEWMVRKWVDDENNEFGTAQPKSERILKRKKSNQKESGREHLRQWVDSLPKLPSHYCRKDTKKLYFEGFQSFAELYREYSRKCKEKNQEALGERTVDNELKSQNVGIFQPRKDQCDYCTEYKVGNVTETDWKKHCDEKDAARKMMDADIALAKSGKQTVLFMDLEAVKLCPAVKASALYYKTKLCVHNFTICNVETMDAMCYWFDETEGDLQASTFASCLVHYLKTDILPLLPSNPIKIYSDGCIYQNRNSTMANALLHLSLDYDIEIIQLFLIKGHTQMVVDSVHATIEKSLKNRDVYLPSDYVKITTEARKKPTAYRAMLLDHSFFKDYNQDLIYDSIRPGRVKGDPVVVDIRRIMYKKGDIEVMVEGDWMSLPRRPKSSPVKNYNFSALHKHRLKIRKTKFKHLQELKPVMPRDVWPYFDKLPSASD